MKKYIFTAFVFLCIMNISYAQKKTKTYVTGRFGLDIAGDEQGFIKPVEKGDTLIYTINKLSDSLLLKKEFNKTLLPPGKKYYLKFKLKKKPD
ncbi:MAG: hypothetical protein ABIP79_00355 [Chitinophagaceae bacterium]